MKYTNKSCEARVPFRSGTPSPLISGPFSSMSALESGAALAGEAAATEHAAILQKTLDASVELCKRAEAAWESRHEEHCKEVRTTMTATLTCRLSSRRLVLSTCRIVVAI